MKKDLSIESFSQFQDFLKYQISLKSLIAGKNFRLKDYSRELGIESPSLLTMLTKGSRAPSKKLVNKLIEKWKLNQTQSRQLQYLADLKRSELNGKPLNQSLGKLLSFAQKESVMQINIDQLDYIRQWHHSAVRLLITDKYFSEDPIWIKKRLRNKISTKQAKDSIALLLRLKLATRGEDGKLSVSHTTTETTNNVPRAEIRKHHIGMLKQAIAAIEEQTIDERLFNSLTLKISPERTKEAREKLTEFLLNFYQSFNDENATEITQVNLNMFSLSKKLQLQTKKGDNNG